MRSPAARAIVPTAVAGLLLLGAIPAVAVDQTPSPSPSASPSPTTGPGQSTSPSPSPTTGQSTGPGATPGTLATARPGPGADPLPEIWAASWILVDATTGEILAAKRPHRKRPPASTLKTLTLLTLLPRLSPDQVTVGTPKAARTQGAKAGVVPGQRYTVRQLFYGLMLPSGNDAAVALAQANGGVKRTVAQMNEVARSLGALDTVAKTPNGLDRPGQVSSAHDLALIARAGLSRPDFAEIVRTKTSSFPNRGRGTHTIYNQNRLLTGGYKGAVGVKTGFTTEAGRTFVGAATRKGHTLIFVGMGIKDRSASAARKALDWGFANLGNLTPIGRLAEPNPASVAATRALPSASPAPSIDLSTAGLEVPNAGDPMAPWWFWALLVAGIAAGAILWWARRVRTSERNRHRMRRTTPIPIDPRS